MSKLQIEKTESASLKYVIILKRCAKLKSNEFGENTYIALLFKDFVNDSIVYSFYLVKHHQTIRNLLNRSNPSERERKFFRQSIL